MEELKSTKVDWKKMAVVGALLFLTAIVVGGSSWWVTNKGCDTNLTIDDSGTDIVTTVPSNFTKITVDGLEIVVPNGWGEFKVDQLTSDSGDAPWWEFNGGQAISEGGAENGIGSGLINVSSYPRVYGAAEGSTEGYAKDFNEMELEVKSMFDEIYSTRTINPEKILTFDWAQIMPINAAVFPNNPRYIESDDSEWRGVWAVSNVGQDINTVPNGVAFMYNQTTGKLATFMVGYETTDSKALWVEIDKELKNSDNDQSNMQTMVDDYLESAYYTDDEVKRFIDEQFLITLKTL
jgi:hypothetical protein